MTGDVTLCVGATADYKPLLDIAQHQARSFGWSVMLYDLGGLGAGRRLDRPVMEGFKFKPAMIFDCLTRCDGHVLYMDLDAVLMEDIGHVFKGSFDLAVTVREVEELANKSDDSRKMLGWTNAGVLFLNATDATRRFVREWMDLTNADADMDQEALNRLLYPDLERVEPYHSFRACGALVLPVEGTIYNSTVHKRDGWNPRAKVVHMTHRKWETDARCVALLDQIREAQLAN